MSNKKSFWTNLKILPILVNNKQMNDDTGNTNFGSKYWRGGKSKKREVKPIWI